MFTSPRAIIFAFAHEKIEKKTKVSSSATSDRYGVSVDRGCCIFSPLPCVGLPSPRGLVGLNPFCQAMVINKCTLHTYQLELNKAGFSPQKKKVRRNHTRASEQGSGEEHTTKRCLASCLPEIRGRRRTKLAKERRGATLPNEHPSRCSCRLSNRTCMALAKDDDLGALALAAYGRSSSSRAMIGLEAHKKVPASLVQSR